MQSFIDLTGLILEKNGKNWQFINFFAIKTTHRCGHVCILEAYAPCTHDIFAITLALNWKRSTLNESTSSCLRTEFIVCFAQRWSLKLMTETPLTKSCEVYTLSPFENGCDATAYMKVGLKRSWSKSLWRNTTNSALHGETCNSCAIVILHPMWQ